LQVATVKDGINNRTDTYVLDMYVRMQRL